MCKCGNGKKDGEDEQGRKLKKACQGACCKTVGRATCMCVDTCTTHTDKRNSRVFFKNLFRVERATELEILTPSARAFNEHEILVSTEAADEERSKYSPIPILKCELVEQSTSLSQEGNEDQIVSGCELIAQSTLLSRGDSGGGSVCDDERHGSGVGNDCRDGGDDSGGPSRRISSNGNSNGGSGG